LLPSHAGLFLHAPGSEKIATQTVAGGFYLLRPSLVSDIFAFSVLLVSLVVNCSWLNLTDQGRE